MNKDGNKNQINHVSVIELGRILWKSEDRSHAFLVGAGASKPDPADIKLSGELVKEFQEEIYNEEQRKFNRKKWASNYEDENKSEDQSEYGFWFSKAYPTKHARRNKVRDLVQEAEPPLGQIILAKMLQDQIISHVFTPNFDDLLLEAAIDLPGVRPTFVDHEARASRFDLSSESSAIFKLHGDYRHYTKNTDYETSELHDKMKEAFERSLREYGTVVIGYGGNDDSIMNVIENTTISKKGLYWCQREQSDLPDRVSELLKSSKNAYLVEIEGSETFFAKLLNKMADDDFLKPDEIENKAKKKADEIRRLMEQAPEVGPNKPEEGVSIGQETASSLNIDHLIDEEAYYDEEGRIDEARNLIRNGDLDHAEQVLNSMLNEDGNSGSVQRELARIAQRRGNYTDARGLLIECRVLAEQANNTKLKALAIDDLARIHRKESDFDKAEKLHIESRDIQRDIGNRAGEAHSLTSLGEVGIKKGKYDQARDYLEEGLKIEQEIDNPAGENSVLNSLGMIARHQGDYQQANGYHKKALEIQKDIGDRHGEGVSLNSLGNVVLSRGDYEQAREYYEEALSIQQELGNRQGESTVLGNLGLVASDQGNYEQAQEYHEKSLDIKRDIGDSAGEAIGLLNIGNIVINQGDYEQAREYYEEALSIQQDIGDRPAQAKTIDNLGLVASYQGNYEKAREYYEDSLEISRELGDRAGEAGSLLNIGDLVREQGDLKKASEYYNKASEIFLEVGAQRKALNVLKHLSNVAEERDDTETALEACEQAIELIEDIELPGLTKIEREFRTRLARLGDPTTIELYARGLECVLASESDPAMELLKETWERRNNIEPDDEEYPFIFGAGVGWAALIKVFDLGESELESVLDTIQSTIEPQVDNPTPASRTLFDHLIGNEADVSPDNLREDAGDINEDEPLTDQLDALESHAYAYLLEILN